MKTNMGLPEIYFVLYLLKYQFCLLKVELGTHTMLTFTAQEYCKLNYIKN